MLSVLSTLILASAAQDLPPAPAQPSVECAQHLTDNSARLRCLNDLLETAEDALSRATEGAQEEADFADLETGGVFDASSHLEAAQSAWVTYRDAECARRASLMFMGADIQEETALNCQILLTRARTTELSDF